MGVIYKILKQQRQQQQQEQQLEKQQRQPHCIHMELSTATKCKVQAAIKQRQEQQQLQQQQREELQHEDSLAEQQLQQLCRFLAENAARKKRQRLKLKLQYQQMEATPQHMEQPLCELPLPQLQANAASTHDMDLLMEQLSNTCTEGSDVSSTATASMAASIAPRDSILLKIRHQIFERKRQRQRQLGELVKQRLVVWRPW